MSNDVSKRSLAQPGRTVEKHVLQRFPPLTRRTHGNGQLLHQIGLTDVLFQGAWAQRPVEPFLF